MTVFEVGILALVQGVTEFLPVSSSGHLVVVRLLFGISDEGGSALDAFLHLGTLVAVLAYYWRVWFSIGRGLVVRDAAGAEMRQLAGKLVLATIPAAVVGYLWRDVFDAWRSSAAVAAGLLVTAIILLAVELLTSRSVGRERATFTDALWMGLAQVVALVPSISRSGITMAAGLARGLSRREATHFSFLMSAPVIAGAGLLSLTIIAPSALAPHLLALGFIISFLAGLASIHLLVVLLARLSFRPFAVYLLVLAGVVWWLS